MVKGIDALVILPHNPATLQKVVEEGGNLLVEGGVLSGKGYESGCYVKPAIAEAENHFEIVQNVLKQRLDRNLVSGGSGTGSSPCTA